MLELAAVATVTLLAVISPGADFAMITRNSILYGRTAGLLSSLGITVGVQLHVFYTMIGVGFLIQRSPGLFALVKMAGAVYLIYIGYKTFFAAPPADTADADMLIRSGSGLSAWAAFKNGFLTNALNPKTTLFVLSVYTQVLSPETPMAIRFSYGLFMSLAHWIWFSSVSLFLSENRLRAQLLKYQARVNQGIGAILLGLGVWLSFSSIA